MTKDVMACGPFDVSPHYEAGLLRAVTRSSPSDHYGGALGAVVTQDDLVHLVQVHGDQLAELTIDGEKTTVSFDPAAENPVGVMPELKTLTVQHTAMRHMVFKGSNLPKLEHLDLNGCAAGMWTRLIIDLPSLESLGMERVMLSHGGPSGLGDPSPTPDLSGAFGDCVSRCPNLFAICCDKVVFPGWNHLYLPKCKRIRMQRCSVEHFDILHAPELSFIDVSHSSGLRAALARDFQHATAQDAFALNALNYKHRAKAARATAVNAMMAELRARDKTEAGTSDDGDSSQLPTVHVDAAGTGPSWAKAGGPRARLLQNARVNIAAEGEDTDQGARMYKMMALQAGHDKDDEDALMSTEEKRNRIVEQLLAGTYGTDAAA